MLYVRKKRRNETHLRDSWLESDVNDLLSRYVTLHGQECSVQRFIITNSGIIARFEHTYDSQLTFARVIVYRFQSPQPPTKAYQYRFGHLSL